MHFSRDVMVNEQRIYVWKDVDESVRRSVLGWINKRFMIKLNQMKCLEEM